MSNKTSFRYASLFSGIGGFEQALNNLGGMCVFSSEIDTYANKAYEILYGHSTYGDITKIDASDVPDHDLLVAGFPCQAFSHAGYRRGFADSRGTLFFEVYRVLKEKMPKAFILENVKGLLSHDKQHTIKVILETLDTLPYYIDFKILNTKDVGGLPQNRERIFIVGIREDLEEYSPWTPTYTIEGKAKKIQIQSTFNFDFPEQKPLITTLHDLLEKKVDEKYYYDKDRVYARVSRFHEGGFIDDENALYRYRTQVLRNVRTSYGKAVRKAYEAKEIKLQRNQLRVAIPREDDICNTLTTVTKDNLLVGYRDNTPYIRNLTEKEYFRLQGFGDEVYEKLVGKIPKTQLYRQAGNAVSVPVVQALATKILPYFGEK